MGAGGGWKETEQTNQIDSPLEFFTYVFRTKIDAPKKYIYVDILFDGVDVLVEAMQDFVSTWGRHTGGNTCKFEGTPAFVVVVPAVFANSILRRLCGIGRMRIHATPRKFAPGVGMLVEIHK